MSAVFVCQGGSTDLLLQGGRSAFEGSAAILPDFHPDAGPLHVSAAMSVCRVVWRVTGCKSGGQLSAVVEITEVGEVVWCGRPVSEGATVGVWRWLNNS